MGCSTTLPLPFSLHTSNTYFTNNVATECWDRPQLVTMRPPCALLVMPLTQLHLGMEGHSLSLLGRVGDDRYTDNLQRVTCST